MVPRQTNRHLVQPLSVNRDYIGKQQGLKVSNQMKLYYEECEGM